MADEPQAERWTCSVFAMGATGGVALDVVALYFSGFPPQADQSWGWLTGAAFRVLVFMALSGVVACLFSNGQLRHAFVIGIAAPSILLNIGASVRQSKDPIPTIRVTPVPVGSLGDRMPLAWSLLQPARAEAQPNVPPPGDLGTVIVKLTAVPGSPGGEAWAEALKGGTVVILDQNGNPLAQTAPSGASFAFTYPPGQYFFRFVGPQAESSLQKAVVSASQRTEVSLWVAPKTSRSLTSGFVSEFLKGATQQMQKISDVRK